MATVTRRTVSTRVRHASRQHEQYRVIARELIAAGVTPALMTALATCHRPGMRPVAEAMTEMAAVR